jgi:hypothetical protein
MIICASALGPQQTIPDNATAIWREYRDFLDMAPPIASYPVPRLAQKPEDHLSIPLSSILSDVRNEQDQSSPLMLRTARQTNHESHRA